MMHSFMVLAIFLLAGSVSSECPNIDELLSSRMELVSKLETEDSCNYAFRRCLSCYDLWYDSGMVKKVWDAIQSAFGDPQVLFSVEGGGPGAPYSPYSPGYGVSGLILDNDAYSLIDVGLSHSVADIDFQIIPVGHERVKEILSALENRYAVFDLTSDCYTDWINHTCCQFVFVEWGDRSNGFIMTPGISAQFAVIEYIGKLLSTSDADQESAEDQECK